MLIRSLKRREFSGMSCVSRWNISKPLIDCTSKSCSPNTRISSCPGDGNGDGDGDGDSDGDGDGDGDGERSR